MENKNFETPDAEMIQDVTDYETIDGMDYGPSQNNNDAYRSNPYPHQPAKKDSEYGLAAMICGILGIMFMGLFPISPGLGVAAVILANKSNNPKEEAYKTVGKITGIVSIVLSVLMLLVFIGIILLAAIAGSSV